LARIREFLLKDELDESQITHHNRGNEVITLENIDASWSELSNQMTIKKLVFYYKLSIFQIINVIKIFKIKY
jgi:hypothetical protein